MPLYFYVVGGRKVRLPVRVVVALPRGIVKVRYKTWIATDMAGFVCALSGTDEEIYYRIDSISALFWKSDGTLISQTNVTENDTDIPVPPYTAYVEWRIPSGANFRVGYRTTKVTRIASHSRTSTIMSFIDEANNITDINVNFVFICSGWNTPISMTSSTMPVDVDIPFCSDCQGDFSVRSALRGIRATIKNSQNAKLQAVLLDANKNVLATCPEQAVGDINTDTEIDLCPDYDPDLVSYLKVNYPNTRYIRVRVDKSNPAGPLPAAIFTIYFSVDKGSIP